MSCKVARIHSEEEKARLCLRACCIVNECPLLHHMIPQYHSLSPYLMEGGAVGMQHKSIYFCSISLQFFIAHMYSACTESCCSSVSYVSNDATLYVMEWTNDELMQASSILSLRPAASISSQRIVRSRDGGSKWMDVASQKRVERREGEE